METNLAGGVIGIIFLVICIGFISFIQPSARQASTHPFLKPNVAAVGETVYLNDTGTLSVKP